MMERGSLRVEAIAHGACPKASGGAEFRDLHQKFVVRIEKERKLRREFVDRQAGADGGFDVGDAVGEGEGDFLHVGRAGFANVIAGDGDGVPVGQFGRGTRQKYL